MRVQLEDYGDKLALNECSLDGKAIYNYSRYK